MKKIKMILFLVIVVFLIVGCNGNTSQNATDGSEDKEYILNAKTCQTFMGCSPNEANKALKESNWVQGHFQSAKVDERGNLVLVLSDEDIEHWKNYINQLFEKKSTAEEADGFKFLVDDDYKCIETYVNKEVYSAAGFSLTFMSVYCGIMQMLNGEDPNEWYVDLKMYDVKTEILITEARFPDESMSVNDEDWDRALKNAEE